MKYNPEIHHRRSIRLSEFDYSTNGAYFVTICTQGRESLFGDIDDGAMTLNEAGRLVAECWAKLPDKFNGVSLDEFIIMPNHFHGIIAIIDNTNHIDLRGESCIRPPLNYQGAMEKQGEHKVRPYGTQNGSVGRIVQAFKSLTTNAYIRGVKQSGWPPFPGRVWQRNYYERVIRDEKEMMAIREYIMNNPANWSDDEENVNP
jgi:REP element-mobilizing transposase RayT